MKHIVILALFCLTSFKSFALENCTERFILEGQACRDTFSECLSNPIFESLCKAQLENCTQTSKNRLTTCEVKQQKCSEEFKSNQEICTAHFYNCAQDISRLYICTDSFNTCSKDSASYAEACLQNAITYF